MRKKQLTTKISMRLPVSTKNKIDDLAKKYTTLNKRKYTRTDVIIKAINEYIKYHLKD